MYVHVIAGIFKLYWEKNKNPSFGGLGHSMSLTDEWLTHSFLAQENTELFSILITHKSEMRQIDSK